jgi:hypothetical protein
MRKVLPGLKALAYSSKASTTKKNVQKMINDGIKNIQSRVPNVLLST